jgi:hypothetical protein
MIPIGATPFTDPDRYDVSLGRRRCDVKSFIIYQKPEISRIARTRTGCLAAQPSCPTTNWLPNTCRDKDVYVFAFVTA